MRKLLLSCLALFAIEQGSYSQDATQTTQNVATRKGVFISQEQGQYRDGDGRATGSYTIVWIIDTLQKQLLNVSTTTKDRRGEVIYLYYYDKNKLVTARAGTVQNGYTIIQNTYAYDEDDYAISEKDLNAFSETEEKYALLKEARHYLAVLKKF